jgi:hypothetical protein
MKSFLEGLAIACMIIVFVFCAVKFGAFIITSF